MPIALRTTDGSSYTFPDEAKFIELQSEDGKIAVVIYIDAMGLVRIVTSEDKEMGRYLSLFPDRKLESVPITKG